MNEPIKPARILVVDDEDRNRRLLAAMLEAEGYTPVDASGGAQALELARQSPPDLVLLDIMMPGMDGYAATRLLKADPATAGIPVCALTAHAMKGDEQKARAAGCDAYLTKPVSARNLLEAVSRALGAKT